MNYKEYKVIDFLKDDGFKDWVLNPDLRKDIFWQETLEAFPEKRQSAEQAAGIIRGLRFETLSGEADYKETLRNIIKAKRSDTWNLIQASKGQSSMLYFQLMKVAASISMIIMISFIILNSLPREVVEQKISMVEKSNPKGRKTTFQLSDGSTVVLNSESKLTFPEVFDSTKRVVELMGEAFFDVAENKEWPFVVIGGNTETTALGTSFNVKVWPEENRTEIALVSGLVKIHHINDETEDIWLQPGEKVTHDFQSNQFVVSSFNFLEVTGWKDKILVFKNASLDEFVKRMEKWYDVKFLIIGENKQPWSIDGEFKDISLEEIIKNLSFLYNIEYQIEGKNVTLKIL